jgi:hypothetical protein
MAGQAVMQKELLRLFVRLSQRLNRPFGQRPGIICAAPPGTRADIG